jgi:rubrerythrin
MIDRDIQRGLDALEEGVLQLKRIAYVMEVTAGNRTAIPLSKACGACGCTLTAPGKKQCPVCAHYTEDDNVD